MAPFRDAVYIDALHLANLPLLAERRDQLLGVSLTRCVMLTTYCLHYLMPTQRDSRIINSLRTAQKYPVPFVKSTRFKNSFILYALANFQ